MYECEQLSLLPPDTLKVRASEYIEVMDFYMVPRIKFAQAVISPYYRPEFTFTEMTKDSNWAGSRSRAPGIKITFGLKDGDFS